MRSGNDESIHSSGGSVWAWIISCSTKPMMAVAEADEADMAASRFRPLCCHKLSQRSVMGKMEGVHTW